MVHKKKSLLSFPYQNLIYFFPPLNAEFVPKPDGREMDLLETDLTSI